MTQEPVEVGRKKGARLAPEDRSPYAQAIIDSGMSREEVRTKMGVSPYTFSYWMLSPRRPDFRNPSHEWFEVFCRVLNTYPEDFNRDYLPRGRPPTGLPRSSDRPPPRQRRTSPPPTR